jgi:e3 binding domain
MDENITPLAKKLAEENSIDWRFIRGTGPAGKVIERDILSYLARIMSGELDLPSIPDASEPAGPSAGTPSMPDMGQVANFESMSASMAKEGVDLNSMLGDFQASTPAQAVTPSVPEYDFSMPVVPAQAVTLPPTPEFDFAMPANGIPSSSGTDDVVISSTVTETAAAHVEVPAVSASAIEADDAVFEFDLDDIDEVEPVTALNNPDLIPTEIASPVSAVQSFDEDHIMTVNDDHDVVVPQDVVTLSPGHDDTPPVSGHDEIPVHISGEFAPVPDPLENLPFELGGENVETQNVDAHDNRELVQTLIVDDATFPVEPELVVDVAEAQVVHEPAALSLEGLAAGAGVLGTGVLGISAALDHAPVVSQDLEPEMPVAAEPVLPVEPEPVVVPVNPEPMIAHFDPEPEPVAAHVEPEPVVVADIPEPVAALEPEPVIAHVEPEPVHVEPIPAVIPAVVATPMHLESSSHDSAGIAPAPGVHKDFFNTNILRRQFNATALMDIRGQISKALNGREVQLGVFVGRAAQRGLYLLGTTDAVTLNKLEAGLVPLSTAGLHHSFIEAVQSVNHADAGAANGLAVLDASNLGIDDLVLPGNGALLALGQISNNIGTLTLSGDYPAKAGAEFLAHVAGSLETPVGLVL